MPDRTRRFTSDQRTPREASGVNADDWGAGNAEGVDLVDGSLVFRGSSAGGVPRVIDDFEEAAYGDQGLSLADYYEFWEYDTGIRFSRSDSLAGLGTVSSSGMPITPA